jgi:hypothetical protein
MKCLACRRQVWPPRHKYCSAACLRAGTAKRSRAYRTEWQARWRADPKNRVAEQARARELERRLRRDARRYQRLIQDERGAAR